MEVLKGILLISANAIMRAAKIVGSEKILAKKIGVSRQLLNYWKHNTLLPFDMALAICLVTKGVVALHELRPDLKGKIREYEILVLKNADKQNI